MAITLLLVDSGFLAIRLRWYVAVIKWEKPVGTVNNKPFLSLILNVFYEGSFLWDLDYDSL